MSVFDINDLIGRVLITFEARITAKHADVDAQLDYEPVFVEADRDRIGQVLHNLIDNAIKFMPENYGLLTINLSSANIKFMSAFAITVRVFPKKILRISLTVSIKLKKHIPTKTDPEQGSGFQL